MAESAPVAPIELARATLPPYGLIQSAREAVRGALDEAPSGTPNADLQVPGAEGYPRPRWAAGFTIKPAPCGGGSSIDPCGNSGGESPSEPSNIGPIYPQPINAAVSCSLFGANSFEARQQRLRDKVAAVASFQLEREFWTGTSAQAAGASSNQWLSKSGGARIINSGAGMGLVTAFSELEQAIAEGSSWAIGMIHAQPRVVAAWYGLRLIEKVGNILVSPLGTIVVPGRGYTGDGPAAGTGDSPASLGGDASWAYATSLVQVRLGPAFYSTSPDATAQPSRDPNAHGTQAAENIDRDANTMTIRGWMDATANWDGCVWAAGLVLQASERTALGS